MSNYDQSKIRNFCIIAHIDHGKSTLADRILEKTGVMQLRDMTGKGFDNKQMAAKAGVPEFTVRKYLGQAKSFSLTQLEEIVRASVQTDENIKTGQMADQLAVELLIISSMQ